MRLPQPQPSTFICTESISSVSYVGRSLVHTEHESYVEILPMEKMTLVTLTFASEGTFTTESGILSSASIDTSCQKDVECLSHRNQMTRMRRATFSNVWSGSDLMACRNNFGKLLYPAFAHCSSDLSQLRSLLQILNDKKCTLCLVTGMIRIRIIFM